jgi:hypothetical protein
MAVFSHEGGLQEPEWRLLVARDEVEETEDYRRATARGLLGCTLEDDILGG